MDTMDQRVLEKWVKYLSSGKGKASASCDFAELIWSDAVTQEQHRVAKDRRCECPQGSGMGDLRLVT